MTKLFRDEINMVAAVEVMSRRIEALEKDKLELQILATTQFERDNIMSRDNQRLTWLERNPVMIDYYQDYWYLHDSTRPHSTLREAIDEIMKLDSSE
jgi:hypothetical protein